MYVVLCTITLKASLNSALVSRVVLFFTPTTWQALCSVRGGFWWVRQILGDSHWQRTGGHTGAPDVSADVYRAVKRVGLAGLSETVPLSWRRSIRTWQRFRERGHGCRATGAGPQGRGRRGCCARADLRPGPRAVVSEDALCLLLH